MLNDNQDAVVKLANFLSTFADITKYDHDERKEAWNIAISFAEIEVSFKNFSEDLLPKLLRENPESNQTIDILLDIGEEFRHILYHIHAITFYDYLKSGPEDDTET